MKTLVLLSLIFSNTAMAADPVLYNTNLQKSWMDILTSPDIANWEKGIDPFETCYKGTVEQAEKEIEQIAAQQDSGTFFSDIYEIETLDQATIGDVIYIDYLSIKCLEDSLDATESGCTSTDEIAKCEF
jgi:hypothetical protein